MSSASAAPVLPETAGCHISDGSCTKTRQLTRKDTDEVVKKALRDNIKGKEWTSTRITSVYVDKINLV